MRYEREARLRPEFGGLYPYLAPGVWECAAVMADRVAAHILGQRSGGWFKRGYRALDPEHFEFRSGEPRPRSSGTRE
jgi:hypothetical protein